MRVKSGGFHQVSPTHHLVDEILEGEQGVRRVVGVCQKGVEEHPETAGVATRLMRSGKKVSV